MLHSLVRALILGLVRLFYPRIEVTGRGLLPPQGPVMYVLNHPNGLIDPLIVMVALGARASFLAKSTFFANPAGKFLMDAFAALPVYRQRDEGKEGGPQGDAAARNEQTFARCRALLRRGGAMALCPEGTTHSEPMMLPLRTGAARIALSAEAENGWGIGLRIVPLGLWYSAKTQFRSSVLLAVGQPFTLAEYREAYERDARATVDALTERIDAGLDTVVLQAENAELLSGIPLVAQWTAPEGYALSLAERHARSAELLGAYARLREHDPQRLEALARQARRYARTLRALGVDDPWDLETLDAQRVRVAWLALTLLITLPLAVAGFALSYGPYRLARPVTPYVIGRHDTQTSTGKLITGALFVLIGWVVWAVAVGWLFGPLWGLLLFAASPALAYVALRWGEGWREVREAIGAGWLRLHRRELADALVARRRALAEAVLEATRLNAISK
jgi:glycerol-3-phosphate O-acyltransferase/dihydroxyacetone phosphate acyltransferase